MELPNYNMESITNAVGTVVMAASIILYKEGYKQDQVLDIVDKITALYMAVFENKAIVTDHGIIFHDQTNIIPISND